MDQDQNINDGVVYHAGFPNASEDAQALPLSLDKLVVKHRASTYFWRMDAIGIPELGWKGGDIVVVDRALLPRHHDFIAAVVNQEFVLRQCLRPDQGMYFIKPDGEHEPDEVSVWGVVTYVVHKVGQSP